MSNHLKVTPAELKSTATSLSSTGNEVKTITAQMVATIDSISGVLWSGEAANAYKTKFKGLQDDINRMVSMINEHVNDLNTMAGEYETAENANIQISGSLSSDVIS